jgi:hypothetical protein
LMPIEDIRINLFIASEGLAASRFIMEATIEPKARYKSDKQFWEN